MKIYQVIRIALRFKQILQSVVRLAFISFLGVVFFCATNVQAAQPNSLQTCSTGWSNTANLRIYNNSDKYVDLYWVNYQCQEIKYTTLNPGTTVLQQSYVTHPWRLRESVSGKLIKQVTLNNTGTTVVSTREQCSAGGLIQAQLKINNNSADPVDLFWKDYNCNEVFYGKINPGQTKWYNSYASHPWRIRAHNSSLILKDIQLNRAGTTQISVKSRKTTDQPDDTSYYQVHPLYVLPSDSIDEKLDINGTITTSMAAASRWMSERAGGQSFKLDTKNGALDISFVRLTKTDAQMTNEAIQTYGNVAFLREVIENELHSLGFNKDGRIYVVYYGGTINWACGGGPLPPDGPQGNVVALYLWGTPAAGQICHNNVFASSELNAGYWEWSILHEVFHSLGAVPNPASPNTADYCAPNATGNGHVSDSPNDLMYAGNLPWQPNVIDFGNDDYFNINTAGCTDIAKSVFLRPADPAAVPPPGWQ